MRLVTFQNNNAEKIGAVIDNRIIDLNSSYKHSLDGQDIARSQEIADSLLPSCSVQFLAGGTASKKAAEQAIEFALENQETINGLVHDLKDVTLKAPITKPGKILCVGHNYREHILEMKREIPEHPVVFAKFSNAVNGPNDEIPLPAITTQLDYEAEFSFVIGKKAKNVTREDALDYVAGYTIVNDVTARDLQRRTLQWFQGKNLDGSAPMGPWLVTTDEIPDPAGLDISLTVNGELRQKSNTDNLVFDVPYLVEFLSHIMTLEAGDVICTGTPGGVGFAMQPQVFLKDGDVVKVEVEKIGAIENKVKEIKQGVVIS
ncbi:FAA hydrolase family protein [Bacillus sp. M6-12]|uniref:fumarylacetoacetate hydrolase family protein n=1 Tax=Bacillus sp. M6-12 TaxID=2054166 RepID=UPI000C772805|nr:fumarylacetoacetate hydrolase family protein [Bacillus sp. M6-12]PLS18541.1 FAA hydrolase family protein [Bacillus sp. M6-12]